MKLQAMNMQQQKQYRLLFCSQEKQKRETIIKFYSYITNIFATFSFTCQCHFLYFFTWSSVFSFCFLNELVQVYFLSFSITFILFFFILNLFLQFFLLYIFNPFCKKASHLCPLIEFIKESGKSCVFFLLL